MTCREAESHPVLQRQEDAYYTAAELVSDPTQVGGPEPAYLETPGLISLSAIQAELYAVSAARLGRVTTSPEAATRS
jgi:hypothetical protein